MKIQKAILTLQKLGRMPDDSDENVPDDLFDAYSNALNEITTPVTYEEAEILIKLFPEDSFQELEWTLLHIFETVSVDLAQYRCLLELCPGEEWKSSLILRLENFLKRDAYLKTLAPTAMPTLQKMGAIP